MKPKFTHYINYKDGETTSPVPIGHIFEYMADTCELLPLKELPPCSSSTES